MDSYSVLETGGGAGKSSSSRKRFVWAKRFVENKMQRMIEDKRRFIKTVKNFGIVFFRLIRREKF
jgi:hypothetical protein